MKSNIKPKPTIFMIFGGTGDLAERKLIPALYNLFLENYLHKEFAIVGLGRTDYNDESFIKNLLSGVAAIAVVLFLLTANLGRVKKLRCQKLITLRLA